MDRSDVRLRQPEVAVTTSYRLSASRASGQSAIFQFMSGYSTLRHATAPPQSRKHNSALASGPKIWVIAWR